MKTRIIALTCLLALSACSKSGTSSSSEEKSRMRPAQSQNEQGQNPPPASSTARNDQPIPGPESTPAPQTVVHEPELLDTIVDVIQSKNYLIYKASGNQDGGYSYAEGVELCANNNRRLMTAREAAELIVWGGGEIRETAFREQETSTPDVTSEAEKFAREKFKPFYKKTADGKVAIDFYLNDGNEAARFEASEDWKKVSVLLSGGYALDRNKFPSLHMRAKDDLGVAICVPRKLATYHFVKRKCWDSSIASKGAKEFAETNGFQNCKFKKSRLMQDEHANVDAYATLLVCDGKKALIKTFLKKDSGIKISCSVAGSEFITQSL